MASGSIDEESKVRRALTERCIGIVSSILSLEWGSVAEMIDEPCGSYID
jgi:hypothetical protein